MLVKEPADCLKKQIRLRSAERRCSVHLVKTLCRIAKKRESEYMMKTEIMEAEETFLQQRLNKAAMDRKPMSKALWSLLQSMPHMPSWVLKPLRAWALSEKKKPM